MRQASIPRVALLVDTSTGWARSIISGVIAYADQHGPWDIRLKPCGTNERLRLPRSSDFDGVIARVVTEEIAEHLLESGVKTVNVSGTEPGRYFPTATYDNDAVVDVAVQHFASRGIRSFGYVGAPGRSYSLSRQRVFLGRCESEGFTCQAFLPPREPSESNAYRSKMLAWLESLPQPVGVFTWGVERGVEVINIAHSAGLTVPDRVAVLGSDDDELICRAVRPSLSGIRFHAERIGYEAAKMLGVLLAGKKLESQEVRFKPAGAVARASTDVLAVRDPDVAAAIRYIRENVGAPMRLSEVADAVAAAPRSLQRGFQRELRHSFSDEVAATRLEYTKRMLCETDRPIPEIAEMCGYGSPEYMATTFRKATGVTPRTYRIQVRGI